MEQSLQDLQEAYGNPRGLWQQGDEHRKYAGWSCNEMQDKLNHLEKMQMDVLCAGVLLCLVELHHISFLLLY